MISLEAMNAAKQAYDIEAACIMEMNRSQSSENISKPTPASYSCNLYMKPTGSTAFTKPDSIRTNESTRRQPLASSVYVKLFLLCKTVLY